MVLHQGEEDEVTTASTASATSEATTRAIDSSANATPSLGTPSDSLDRNVDPKQIMDSSDDIESERQVCIVKKQKSINLKEASNPEEVRENMTTPPPSYSIAQSGTTQSEEKLDMSGKRLQYYFENV